MDRVEWAKQLVGNAVRSPHTRQAYEYALEQFFHWAAGRAVSRESVQPLTQLAGSVSFSVNAQTFAFLCHVFRLTCRLLFPVTSHEFG